MLARDADPFQRVIGTFIGVLMAGVGLWAVCASIVGPSAIGVVAVPRWVALFGWAFAAIGSLGTVVAQMQMGGSWRIGIDDRPTGLVDGGLYRWVRNPIYSSMLAFMLGVVLLAPSAWTVFATFAALLLISLQTRLEEAHLLALHGDRYRRYASQVGRFIPGVGRLEAHSALPKVTA